MGISNSIMNLLKFRSGKLINKRIDIFFLENFIKVLVSHLAIKTYYPFAKRFSKQILDCISGGRIFEEILEKISLIIYLIKEKIRKKRKGKK
jgi:hypothetical protein